MKCGNCGTKNEPKNKFCSDCGTDLQSHPDSQAVSTTLSELFGKEVDVLFFLENYTGKISGIVNPSHDQIGRYRDGILQRITIETPAPNDPDENIGAVLTFIRESKEYLGEKYEESYYRSFTTRDLKKEYLKLFEKILRVKSKNTPPPSLPGVTSAPSDLKKL